MAFSEFGMGSLAKASSLRSASIPRRPSLLQKRIIFGASEDDAADAAAAGDRVVYEWEGYTIGYFGRPFEKKAGLKGGDFAGERDYSRFVVGRGAQIKFRGASP